MMMLATAPASAMRLKERFILVSLHHRARGLRLAFALGASHIWHMPPNLSPEECATIAADRYPLSPRVQSWKGILDKLEPPAPKREPLPPLPSMVVARMRGTRRRR
jgi:hypothetical protein